MNKKPTRRVRKVALLGTGLMGFPMAKRLLEAGHDLVVYNRTQDKLRPLQKAGARMAVSAQDAVAWADVVIFMLSDAAAIKSTLFAGEQPDLTGKTIIQMGTIAPGESRRFLEKVRQCAGDYFECPVLGSRAEAAGGRLILMAGAEAGQFKEWKGFLSCFGPDPQLIGEVGTAAALKIALNQLIASLGCAFSLSLALVQSRGIAVERFMEILRQSALYAPMFDKKLPSMLAQDYKDANFPVKHLLKDVRLFLGAAAADHLDTNHLRGVERIIERALSLGRGEEDYSAIFEAIRPQER